MSQPLPSNFKYDIHKTYCETFPFFSFQPPLSGHGKNFSNYANIVCRTEDETMITLDGKPIHPNIQWTRLDHANLSYTSLSIESKSIILELEGRTFGVIFSGKVPYEAYSNPGGLSFVEKEKDSGIDLDEFVAFTIPPLGDTYVAINGSVITSKPDTGNETSSLDEFFALSGNEKEKMTAGITVTIIVIVVIVAKIVFCMFTLKSSNI